MKGFILALITLAWSTGAAGQGFDLYVIDANQFSVGPWQIIKYDDEGKNPEPFITENLAWPHDLLFLEEAGTALVSNNNNGKIERYNAETGQYIDTFAEGLGGPSRMMLGTDGLLYVCQTGGNQRVRRFQLDGTQVDDFTGNGVARCLGMDWDSGGDLYLGAYDGQSVHRFNTEGIEQALFIGNNLAGPVNIWFDEDGDLLVIDYNNGAVKRFDSTGRYENDFITGLSEPEGVAFLRNGDILIGDGGTGAVKRFNSEGEYIEDLVTSGTGGLAQPNAVVVRYHPVNINAGIADAWFNPVTAGQGFFISVFTELEQLFVSWFTFDTVRPPEDTPSNLGEPGHRWLTAQGAYDGDTATLTLNLTQGGVFDSPQPPATTDPEAYGTMIIIFETCMKGTVEYEIPSLNLSGTIPIERIVNDNVALCEALN